MAAHNFEDLQRHVGHAIECVYYGDPDNPANVSVECETCHEVIMSYDNPGWVDDPEEVPA